MRVVAVVIAVGWVVFWLYWAAAAVGVKAGQARWGRCAALRVAIALIAPYFLYSAVVEERDMTRLFPDQYPAYQRSTKMLIPFVL
ncbi:protein-S-isoprenylcysteine O-methyltransferase Ste14 [Kitasatospora sp. MAA4]|uniref:hypothetical protein n=1 Tax=Kitasatospora sp. MAA4 TaxID=3035093 RepID=UPI0024770762|nr:hypothetical protein [Kitasatospora sp. MAA4]MDH6133719.1 protein-S-isoprenylcysteine O-methyltransferase Ste14 [Kitasatospora sp. MAA4]